MAVLGQTPVFSEGDNSDVSVTESFLLFAHGDHMFLAWQSHQVPVKNQQHRPTALIGQPPRATIVRRQCEVTSYAAS